MKARNLDTIIQEFKTPEILSVYYDLDKLEILYSVDENEEYRIVFDSPEGFKCLDERDMCDYWQNKEIVENWIVEILEGGWLDMEKSRSMISHKMSNLREFLVEGLDDCITIISQNEPKIEKEK